MKYNSKTNIDKNSAVDKSIMIAILSMIDKNNGLWSGTMTDLRKSLLKSVSKTEIKLLPGSPSSMRVVLNRIVNKLRNRSVSVRFGRTTDHMRTRYVKFAR